MRHRSFPTRRAFTFVEALIVLIVLGIMAATMVPQFTSSSREARRSRLASTVQSVRSHIERYKQQHGDALPDITTSWNGLYLKMLPKNPLRGGAVTVKNGTNILAGETYGFVYDYGTAGDGSGRFWGVDEDADGKLSLIGD